MNLQRFCYKSVSFALIITLLCTTSISYASESLTATVAAANSASVRHRIETEIGSAHRLPVRSLSEPTYRVIESLSRSELRQRSGEGRFRMAANGHIMNFILARMILVLAFYLPLDYKTIFAVPPQAPADWLFLFGYSLGTGAVVNVGMELLTHRFHSQTPFVINSFEFYRKNQNLNFNVSDIFIGISFAFIVTGCFLRHASHAWWVMFQTIVIMAVFVNPFFDTPLKYNATREHVKDVVRANTTLFAQLLVPVFLTLTTILFWFLEVLPELPGLLYLTPGWIGASILDAYFKWHASVYSPFTGARIIVKGVVNRDGREKNVVEGELKPVQKQIDDLFANDPDINLLSERLAREKNFGTLFFDEQPHDSNNGSLLSVDALLRGPGRRAFEKRNKLRNDSNILLIRVNPKKLNDSLTETEVRTELHAKLDPLLRRSELRLISNDELLLASVFLAAIPAIAIIGRKLWQRNWRHHFEEVNGITRRIGGKLLDFDIDPAIELKWLDLRPVAESLMTFRFDESKLEERLELLIQLIRELRRQLQPNPGGAGYAKALDTNRKGLFDIKPLFIEAWNLYARDDTFQIRLEEIRRSKYVVYRPHIEKKSRSELRAPAPDVSEKQDAAIRSLTDNIIGRLVESRESVLGVKLRLIHQKIETQLRRRNTSGIPTSQEVEVMSSDWLELFPERLAGEELFAIDVIPSEDFPVSLIPRDQADDYKVRFASALKHLVSPEGLRTFLDKLQKNTRESFWLDSDKRFEAQVGRFPRRTGVFFNIYIHPPTVTIPRNKTSVAQSILGRFVGPNLNFELPNSVELVVQNHFGNDMVVSNYFRIDDDGVAATERRERRYVEEGAESALIHPIQVKESGEVLTRPLSFVTLYRPSFRVAYNEPTFEELTRELVSIFESLGRLRLELAPGEVRSHEMRTQHFSVNVARSRKDTSIYSVNINFLYQRGIDLADVTPHSAMDRIWSGIQSDIDLAISLNYSGDFQAVRPIIMRIYDNFLAHKNDPDFQIHFPVLVKHFNHFIALLSSRDFRTFRDLKVALQLSDEMVHMLQVMPQTEELINEVPFAIGALSQLAAGFLTHGEAESARAVLTQAKEIFRKYRESADPVKLGASARFLFTHYSNLLGLFLYRIQAEQQVEQNVADARRALDNVVAFAAESNLDLVPTNVIGSFRNVIIRSINRADELLEALHFNSEEEKRRRAIQSHVDALREFLDKFDRIYSVRRSELRLWGQLAETALPLIDDTSRSPAFNSLQRLLTSSSARNELPDAFVVSRSLALDHGMIPVLAAIAQEGIPVVIIAPSKEVDQLLVTEFNRGLKPGLRLMAAPNLLVARQLLASKLNNRRLVYLKGEDEGKIDSERLFDEVIVLSDRAIEELKMSVRGLASLMNRAALIYNRIYQSA